jgi:predicted oxidoreductase
MGQVTIYLQEDIEKKMLRAVDSSGLSKSKWIASVIKEKVDDEWPQAVREMAGKWESFPESKELRSTIGKDGKREPF